MSASQIQQADNPLLHWGGGGLSSAGSPCGEARVALERRREPLKPLVSSNCLTGRELVMAWQHMVKETTESCT